MPSKDSKVLASVGRVRAKAVGSSFPILHTSCSNVKRNGTRSDQNELTCLVAKFSRLDLRQKSYGQLQHKQ